VRRELQAQRGAAKAGAGAAAPPVSEAFNPSTRAMLERYLAHV
jgi:hypothetical protein